MNKNSLSKLAFLAISATALMLQALPNAISAQETHGTTQPAAGQLLEGAGRVAVTGDLSISQAFSRATLPNAPVGGGYLTVSNGGTEADRLVSASSPAAGSVQFHEMKMEGDVMRMRPIVGGIEIPANGSVTLAPGGLHLMFLELKRPFVEGETLPVTLQFEKAGSLDIALPILGAAAKAAPMDHSSH